MRTRTLLVVACLACLATSGRAAAQKAVLVVRHAENAGDRLLDAGQARAQHLVSTLGRAGVAAIYATDSVRAKQTVAPLAQALKLPVDLYSTDDGKGGFDARPFVQRLSKEHPRDVVVVVGHVTTIPDLLKALGCRDEVAIAPLEYDDLFVVVPEAGGPATLVRLKE